MTRNRKTVALLLALSLGVSLPSCGSSADKKATEMELSESTIGITPELIVGGEQGQLFSVVENNYNLKIEDRGSSLEKGVVSFTMQREPGTGFDLSKVGGHADDDLPYVGTLRVEILDESGITILEGEVGSESVRKLCATAEGDKVGITFSSYVSDHSDLTQAKSFRVSFSTTENKDYGKTKASEKIVNALTGEVDEAAEDIKKAAEVTKKAAETAEAIGNLLR